MVLCLHCSRYMGLWPRKSLQKCYSWASHCDISYTSQLDICILSLGWRSCRVRHSLCVSRHSGYACWSKHARHDWDSVIPTIASALNEAPLELRGRCADGTARSPLEVISFIQHKRSKLRQLLQVSDPVWLISRISSLSLFYVVNYHSPGAEAHLGTEKKSVDKEAGILIKKWKRIHNWSTHNS